LKALIVEDEYQSQIQLDSAIKKYCPEISITGIADNIDQAVSLFLEHRPEIIFLDVNLGTESGFDLLEKIQGIPYSVIFITAYEEYALKAIKFSALDYLLKPIVHTELIASVQKAKKFKISDYNKVQLKNLLNNLNLKNEIEPTIAVPQSQEIILLKISQIIYLEAANNYTLIYSTTNEKLIISKGIYYFQELLGETGFIRVHQSYLVNQNYIRSIRKDSTLELMNKKIVPISKLKIAQVREILLSTKL
jgi:two-component system LytT family response regulator